jgi:hypothetical protein
MGSYPPIPRRVVVPVGEQLIRPALGVLRVLGSCGIRLVVWVARPGWYSHPGSVSGGSVSSEPPWGMLWLPPRFSGRKGRFGQWLEGGCPDVDNRCPIALVVCPRGARPRGPCEEREPVLLRCTLWEECVVGCALIGGAVWCTSLWCHTTSGVMGHPVG